MNINYLKKVLKSAARDPRKIRSMWHLKMSKRTDWRHDYNAPVKPKAGHPFVIALRMNYSCNLRCVMCNQWGENGVFIKTPDRMVRREMALDDFKRFIDDVADFSPSIYFTGGEPLMNKDIIELVKHCNDRHLITSMSTNSTFLPEKGEALIKAGLDYLFTSLDAPESVEENIIRKKAAGGDSQTTAATAIRDFIRLRDKIGNGLPLVQVQTIVVKENQDKLLDMAHFVEDVLKPDVWGVQLCVFTTPEQNAKTTATYQANFNQDQVGWAGFIREFEGMDFEKIQKQLDIILKTRWKFQLRAYRPIGMKGFNIERYYAHPEEFATDEPLTCLNPYVFAQLQPNGDIAFCGSQPDYTIGNVKGNKFLDLWNGERANNWRAFLQKQLFPSCTRCFTLHEYRRFRGA